jgi:hypothetical protein
MPLADLRLAHNVSSLNKSAAEIDKRNAEAVAGLLSALDSQQNVVIRVGAILIVKRSGTVMVKHLNTLEQ